MRLPNQFNIMLVANKRPLASWKHLIDRPQTAEEKSAVLDQGAPGSIGIVTGSVSSLLVLDIDGPEGEKSIEGLHIPRTPMVRTPHGRHFYFRWTPQLDVLVTTKAGVLNGVDVRGDGGYVVFYGWTTPPELVPFAAPPAWLVGLLGVAKSAGMEQRTLARIQTVREGTRNEDFFRMASSFRARGCNGSEIYGFLEPKAKEVDFPLDELRTICNRIERYPAPEQPKAEAQGESVESFLAEQEPVKWICKPFIAEQSIGIIGGLPESRKSWIMVDLAVECARGGGLWLNKFPVAGAKVLLIDQERSKAEVQRRLKAILAGKGLSAADIRSQLFVRSGTSSRIDLDRSFNALRKEISDLRPSLILVDSLATFHTLNESSRGEIQRVMERIKEIRNEFKCSVLLIHHETKNSYQNKREGAEPSYLDLAGNVAIPAAAEVVINVVKHDSDSSFVHHTKSTQGSKAPPFLVRVRDEKPDGSEIVVEAF